MIKIISHLAVLFIGIVMGRLFEYFQYGKQNKIDRLYRFNVLLLDRQDLLTKYYESGKYDRLKKEKLQAKINEIDKQLINLKKNG